MLLCTACQATIREPEPPLCRHCGASLQVAPAAASTHELHAILCRSCASGRGPASLTALRVAALYEGAVRTAILALKYRGQRRAAEPLGALLAAHARLACWQPELILAVPLHPDRLSQRGYNQADLLARQCARDLRVTHSADLLIRRRATRPQVGLNIDERHANVFGAFAIASPRAARSLAGRRILLIDDVTTTGSTLDAAASALVPLRPAAIWGLAVSRPDLASHNADASSASAAVHASNPRHAGPAQ